jgi:hypothetical protein
VALVPVRQQRSAVFHATGAACTTRLPCSAAATMRGLLSWLANRVHSHSPPHVLRIMRARRPAAECASSDGISSARLCVWRASRTQNRSPRDMFKITSASDETNSQFTRQGGCSIYDSRSLARVIRVGSRPARTVAMERARAARCGKCDRMSGGVAVHGVQTRRAVLDPACQSRAVDRPRLAR